MKTTAKMTVLATAILLAACSSGKAPKHTVTEPMPHMVHPSKPNSQVRNPQRDFVKQTRRSLKNIPNHQRRVVQIAAPRKRAGILVDIQEGRANGVQRVTSRYGENHIVYIARHYPTLILTPFADPDTYDNRTEKEYGFEFFGSNIVVNPRSNKRIWLTIYDKANPRGLPITMTLIPKAGMMAQTINAAADKSPIEEANGLHPSEGGFQQQLTKILKTIVEQKLPAGFTVRPLRENFALGNGMKTMPVERYHSTEFDVYRYRVTNVGQQVFEFDQRTEEAYRKLSRYVRAVAPYPLTTVYPGETTDVLILISKRGGKNE